MGKSASVRAILSTLEVGQAPEHELLSPPVRVRVERARPGVSSCDLLSSVQFVCDVLPTIFDQILKPCSDPKAVEARDQASGIDRLNAMTV